MTSGDNNEEVIFNEYRQLVKSAKQFAEEKLANFDWIERLRLRAGQYIENNGPNTTADEVTDFLIDEATRTFPNNLRDEMMDKLDLEIAEIMSSFRL